MRRLIAIITMVLLGSLGLVGTGNAQLQSVQIQGTIQAVDCQTQQLILNTSGGPTTLQVTNQTAIYANGTPASLCALGSVVGAPATALVAPSDNQFVLGRVDVGASVTPAQPAPGTVLAPSTPPIVGIAIGALLLGGLAYLILHHPNNNNRDYNPDDYSGRGYSYGPYRRCADGSWNQWCR